MAKKRQLLTTKQIEVIDELHFRHISWVLQVLLLLLHFIDSLWSRALLLLLLW